MRAAALVAVALSTPVQVQASSAVHSDEPVPAARATTLDPVVVSTSRGRDGSISVRGDELLRSRVSTSDTASLLRGMPGVSVYGAGGISSLPAIRGLADDRVRTLVDGMDLAMACPNHMNPALSFIDPTRVAAIDVYAGITPVSQGGDSIAGTIQVRSAPPKFADAEAGSLAEGAAGRFHRSNGHAHGGNVAFTLAGEQVSFSYSESVADAGNYHAAGRFKRPGLWQTFGARRGGVGEEEVVASEYRGIRNRDIGLAARAGAHLLQLGVGEQRVGYQGFPNQRMDMVASIEDPSAVGNRLLDLDKPANINRLLNLRYTGWFEWGTLEGRLFNQRLRHQMDLLQDRFFGLFMPMDAQATTTGGALTGSLVLSGSDLMRVGGDFQRYRLDDWWPPVGVAPGAMCCNDFRNVRDGKRDRFGLFAEWEAQWGTAWSTQLGVRHTVVDADTGPVQGYSNLAIYTSDARRFNARSRARRDRHVDLALLGRYTPTATETYEAGVARKSRSPNLYERYAWATNAMPALMNNFVGDGNGYIGNPDLAPETAHSLSASAAWHDAGKEAWGLKVSAYVTRVDDFIDARRCTPALSSQCSAANATASTSYVLLQYANQSARLNGFELSGRRLLARSEQLGSLTAAVQISYVRGRNTHTGDDLYNIMPLDTRWQLLHRSGGWSTTLEVLAVGAKGRVSRVRNEVPTPGHTIVNLSTSYEWKHARIDIALENATNALYFPPLGGAYLAQGNPMTTAGVPWGMTVPGKGRSLNAGLSMRF